MSEMVVSTAYLSPGTAAAPYPLYPGTAGAVGAPTGERVLVTGRSAITTGLTQSGCSGGNRLKVSILSTLPGFVANAVG